jgi:hypothetical protein
VLRESLAKYYIVSHKSHMISPGIELDSPPWEADSYLLEQIR